MPRESDTVAFLDRAQAFLRAIQLKHDDRPEVRLVDERSTEPDRVIRT